MAVQLIDDMTQTWNADGFRNSFADEIHKLVEQKATAGEIAEVAKVDSSPALAAGADVLDLTSLLKRSLEGKTARQSGDGTAASVTKLPSAARKTTASAKKAAPQRKSSPPAKKAKPAKPAAKKPARRAAA